MATKDELYNQGLDLYGQGKHREAIAEYQKALEIDPEDGEIYMAISMCYQMLGEWDPALEAARRAVDLSPREPLSYTNLSRVLVKKGMIPEAEEAMAISRQLSMGYL
ncbi:MAG TPA: tetratricopeptide repeat protein [bacterium]|nr:tetratricopeptide repeat protein [bacterium]HXK95179.1 tetratricopeptide repeat protein [bacterium]